MTNATETAIAADLALCDIGMAFTKGHARRKFVSHRTACFAALKTMNAADGLDTLSDDDLLAALTA
ncbi:hypothetical protein [Acidiphilium acidophilum]|uniref:Uncharacterized protein n=1 Tax=Acidiphilium acidophilum TaxID=76588 RepID=A0AAW9DL50_ACIAO|nr:hypothetical protein [Acidiphilium acidophilum]MDX5929431.1 hypothetical protein [Acidiphilium acidophilum]GBR74857.1 hypothetical protein AA700_0353 [Acidiphilium acidophilum DSM 700]